MKTFLAVFTGNAAAMDAFRKLPEAQIAKTQAEGAKAWHAWVDKNKASLVQMGGPLGKTKKISKAGIEDVRNNLGAFTVVQAESQEAAAKLFVGHPHFTIFPGDGVEVMEVLPIPAR